MNRNTMRLALSVAGLLMATVAHALTETVNGYTWTYRINEDDTAEIYGPCTKEGPARYDSDYIPAVSPVPTGVVTVPSSLGGKPVTSIGDFSFRECKGLTSVTLPSGVTSLGYRSFSGCSGLTSVTILGDVDYIGDSAFYECTALKSIALPESVGSGFIGMKAFYNCTALAQIVIPDGVETIEEKAFGYCSGLTDVVIPDSVTTIGTEAFSDCRGLKSVTIGKGVMAIGHGAFYNCNNLSSVHITDLAAWCGMFRGEFGFESWYDESRDEWYDDSIIEKKAGTVFSSPYSLYVNGSKLTELVIPDGVTNISAYAFNKCESLTSVTIPDSVESIGDGAFRGCSGLADANGFVVIRETLHDYVGEAKTAMVPEGVRAIGGYAFSSSGVLNLAIPDSVTYIERDAFSGGKMSQVTFFGDAPDVGQDGKSSKVFSGTIYVYRDSTGWGVSIPGTWMGSKIAYRDSNPNPLFMPWNVAFDANGGAGEMSDKQFFKIAGTVQALPSCTFTNGVQVFGGWSLAPDSEAIDFFDGEMVEFGLWPTNVTLYAQWAEPAVISFNANGGYGEMPPQTVGCGYAKPLAENAFSRKGYGFVGWATTPGGEVVYTDGALITAAGDVTLHAVWHETHTVSFDANGGSRVMADVYVFTGTTNALPACGFVRTGHRFVGWAETAGGDVAYEDGADIAPERDMTLYAVWCDYTVAEVRDGVLVSYDLGPTSKLVIPEGVAEIPEGFFAGGGRGTIKTLVLPSTLQRVYDSAGMDLERVAEVQVPDLRSWLQIADGGQLLAESNLYGGNVRLLVGGAELAGVVEIPEGLETISAGAFCGCPGITAVAIPQSVRTIGGGAFYRCNALSDVRIDSLADWLEIDFEDGDANPLCNGGMLVIGGERAQELQIPEGTTRIRPYAFAGMRGVSSVTIPDSVKGIGIGAFDDCGGHWKVTDEEDAEAVWMSDEVSCIDTETVPGLMMVDGWVVDYDNSVTSVDARELRGIAAGAFHYSRHGDEVPCRLTSVKLPNRMEELGEWTFGGCGKLKSVAFPAGLKRIGEHAFEGCTSLSSVSVPLGLTGLGRDAFAGCSSLKAVSLPNTITGNLKNLYFKGCNKALKITSQVVRKITFNANGGELVSVALRLVSSGAAVGALPAAPTRENYVFAGWYTAKTKGAKITAKTKVSKNVTYYARWTPKKFPVTVVKDGAGTVKGAGSKPHSSKVTLTATAAKGSVFQGWYDANEKWRMENGELPNGGMGQLVSQKTSYSFTMPTNAVTLTAKFITKAEDKAGIGMEFGGVGFGAMAGTGEPPVLPVVTNTCGVVTTWPVAASGLTAVSVSVSGQPKGMKYDAKKKAVTGVPSVANKSGTMKITVKSAGASRTWSVKWRTVALPAFARGTFNGWTYEQTENGEWKMENAVRKVTVSVTGAGKITAKVGSLSLARTGWTAGEDGLYRATLSATRTVGTGKKAKKYKDVMTLVLDPAAEWTENQLTGTVGSYLATDLDTPLNSDAVVSARRNPFGDNAEAKDVAAQLNATGAKQVTDGDGLVWNVKVAANGVATILRTTGSGKNKKTVSATAVVEVVPAEGDGYLAMARFLVNGKVLVASWP